MAKTIKIHYRAPSHVPLWKVMEVGGFLAKRGLEMDMGSLEGQRKQATEGLKIVRDHLSIHRGELAEWDLPVSRGSDPN